MSKVFGLTLLLVAVLVFTGVSSPGTDWAANLENLMGRTGRFGIIGIGVAFVIVTGGIDLSIGSVVGLIGVLLPMLIVKQHWSPWLAIPTVLALGAFLGLCHGLLVTRLKLQPFVVTLCGLMFYRGIARFIADDRPQGWGTGHTELRDAASGSLLNLPAGFVLLGLLAALGAFVLHRVGDRRSSIGLRVAALLAAGVGIAGFLMPESLLARTGVPSPFLLLVVVGGISGLGLSHSVWGRHLLALGQNEQAARFSGVRTERLVLLSYVLCSGLAGLAAVLFALKQSSVQPATAGNFYELYAIAAAVLGGCSLRGGEATILGVVVGTALLRTLLNAITLLGFDQQLEFAIIGVVILIGVSADEIVRRVFARRRTTRAAPIPPPPPS